MSHPPPQDLARRNHREFGWLLLAVVVVGVLLVAMRYADLNALVARESRRLQAQATVMVSGLEQQLTGVRSALGSVRHDLVQDQVAIEPARLTRALDALAAAQPVVRSLWVVDAAGQVRSLGGDEVARAGHAAADWFQRLRDLNDPQRLVLGRPRALDDGGRTMEVAMAVVDGRGRFDGAVVASLDTDHLDKVLGAQVFAPDIRAGIRHADGTALIVVAAQSLSGPDSDAAGEGFYLHIAAGQPVSVQRGGAHAVAGERLTALHNLQPAALGMDQPLVLGISRSMAALLAPWRQQTLMVATLWLGAALAACSGLWMAQRRRQEREAALAEQMARQATDAERLRLALHGGDLALWDLDVRADHATVNERWGRMLGYAPSDPEADGNRWHEQVHPDDRPGVLALQQAHLDGHSDHFEATYRLRHRDGSWIWVLDRGRVVERDAQGRPLRMVGTHLDISERVRAEQALRRSEARSRGLLASLHSGVVVHASDGRVLEANPAACSALGLTLAQVQGKAPLDPSWAFLDEDGALLPPSRVPVNRVLAGESLLRDLVVGLRRPDLAAPSWALCSAFALRDESQCLQEVVVTFYDITARRQAEQAVRQSADRMRLAGRLARLGGWTLERGDGAGLLPEAGRVTLSPEAGEVLGVDAAVHWKVDTLLSRVADGHRALLARRLAGDEPFDVELPATGPEGEERTLRLLGEPVRDAAGRAVGFQGALQDVTESRREQQQLRLMQSVVSQLNDMVVITAAEPLDEPGPPIVFVNEAFERLTGWRSDEVRGRSPRLMQSPQTDPRQRERIRHALQCQQPVRAELLNVARDGRPYWVDILIAPLSDADGRVTHMVAVERDITDRKLTEAQAREAREALAATLDAVPDLLFDVDLDGCVHDFHSPRRDLLYTAPEGLLGRRMEEVLPAEAAQVVMQALQESHQHGYSSGREYALTLDGAVRWFELSVARKGVTPGQPPRFIALVRDISERKQGEAERLQLERRLREAQKIESLGTLAGGIAHDFNNILPAILGHVELARGELPGGHPALQSLEQIRSAAARARSLVQQILTFSRRQPQQLVDQPMQGVLGETLALLRATLPASVRLDTSITDDSRPVAIDGTQVQQVLMNLCTNAWHALPDGRGRIEVGLAAVAPAEAVALAGAQAPPGPCMHLWVRDDGCGMDEPTRERIFDPFFTTKPVGQGTGLGLSVVHGIVRGHGGGLSVETQPGQGSCFHVLWPLSATPVAPAAAPALQAAAPSLHRPGQSVWYVDDDPVMLVMVQRLLARAGYEVTACDGGLQALALAEQSDQAPALVVTDYNMPELSGLDLARRLTARWPGLPIVLSTGYGVEGLRAAAASLGVRALLHKENTLEELPALVSQLLSEAAGPPRAEPVSAPA